MFKNSIKIRINYCHTDKMGYVYYGNYPAFYEMGRTELFREIEIAPLELEKKGIMLPVRKLEVEYFAPAYYDELIEVNTQLVDYSPLQITLGTEILNSSGKIVNKGKVQLILVDTESGRPKRSYEIYEYIKEKVGDYEERTNKQA